MRARSRNRSHGETGTLWISFSDLMSALMLIFVLVLFYAVYQYYDMLEIKTAELLRQSGILDQQAAQLTLSQQELESKEAALNETKQALESKEDELNEQSQKLTETEQAQLLLQAKLVLQESTLNSLQARLSEQEEQLKTAQASLDEATAAQQLQQAQLEAQQAQLYAQQTQMEAQQTQMEAQQAQLDKLVGVKSAIIEELVRALADSNISGASVDESGAIVFSSEMLFDVNRSTLKDVGKAFLNSFIPGYLKVLMSDEYSQYVSQIVIEGHTDTDGTFLKNMQLSQERAYAVLRYILSSEFTGISSQAKLRLQEIVTVNGRSFSDPIYRANGSVDMAASRRVVIKFRLNDEEMVNEMLSILENMNR
ncbi:MAG: OmpA family protein [Clostridia bacterium]|nr:OmpA family protein [Clostridia bacterium]